MLKWFFSFLLVVVGAAGASAQNTPAQNQALINAQNWACTDHCISGPVAQGLFNAINNTFGLYAALGGSNTWTGANVFSGVTTLGPLAVPLSYTQGGTGGVAGFVAGNIAVGASNHGLIDSGVQPALNYATNRAPTVTDCLGFSPGSQWTQTPAGPSFSMYDNSGAPTNCVWGQNTPAVYHSNSSVGWTWTQTTNLTPFIYYTAPGFSVGVNANYENPLSLTTTISNLVVQVSTPPGAGQSVTYTVYTGALRTLATATSVSCTMSGASQTLCIDSTHSAIVTVTLPGSPQGWALQLSLTSGAAAPAISSSSVQMQF